MHKAFGYTLLLFSISAATGYAADLTAPPAPPAAMDVTTFSWTGPYVGVNLGAAFGGDDRVGYHSDGVYLGDFGKLNGSGFIGGGQIGYNYQMDSNWLIGLEADFQGGDISDSVTSSGVHTKSKVDWFGTVRPRVGYVYDRTVFYGTGGLAYGHVSYKSSVGGVNVLDDDKTKTGWTAGAGVEHAFTDHLTAKLEYDYVSLGSSDLGSDALSTKASPDFHTIRVGLNYKF
jgi:outer membrane immunogenic protein